MLKRIVKYGNSNAIILDKALLELLNIQEGSLLKIKTDGKSLIFTPHEPVEQEKESPTFTAENMIHETMIKRLIQLNPEIDESEQKEILKKMTRAKRTGKISSEDILKIFDEHPKLKHHDTAPQDDREAMQREMVVIRNKYADIVKKIGDLTENNSEFIHQSQLLAEKAQQTGQPDMYLAELHKLIEQFLPESREYYAEMGKLVEKYRDLRQDDLTKMAQKLNK